MDTNNVIDVKDVHISYYAVKGRSIRKSFFKLKKSQREKYEAVRGVTFSVKEGQIVGLIGKNGSGKSTMLRAIAGIFSPDKGEIDTHGRSVALLSIGVGFQKKLTGYENIYLSGLLLGFSKAQIKAKEKEIIEFSELGKFIYKPVKTYSSGMYSKLAFSITAILETEVTLIDEVFSVGDARFKKKSYEKMEELITKHNRTVMIVSHSTSTLKKLCDSVIWLHDGQVKMHGEANEVIEAYTQFMESD